MKMNQPNQLNIIPLGNRDSIMKTNKVELNNHEVFLDEELGEPSEYREVISALFNAAENDSFLFYINTPGGQLNTTMALVEGIKNTPANVTGVLMGETHSGGSMIAMWCHNLAVLDSAEMLIHTASFGTAGFTGNVKAHADFACKQVENLIDIAYEGFLSKQEIASVKSGVEMWFDASEIRTRFEKRTEHMKRKEAAENKTSKKKKVETTS